MFHNNFYYLDNLKEENMLFVLIKLISIIFIKIFKVITKKELGFLIEVGGLETFVGLVLSPWTKRQK